MLSHGPEWRFPIGSPHATAFLVSGTAVCPSATEAYSSTAPRFQLACRARRTWQSRRSSQHSTALTACLPHPPRPALAALPALLTAPCLQGMIACS